MTTSSPGPETGSGGASTPSIDWVSLIDDFGKLGQSAAKKFNDQASATAQTARDGSYSVDKWLQDLESFWKSFADYAVGGIEILRSRLPKS